MILHGPWRPSLSMGRPRRSAILSKGRPSFRACSTTHSGPLTAKSVLAYLARRTSVCENFRSAFRRNWARINAANARMSPSSSSWYTAAIVERLNLLSVDLLPCILCGSLSCSRHVASVSSRCSFRCPNLFRSARVICWSQASFADLGDRVSSLSALESQEGTNLIRSKTLSSPLCGRSRCTTLTALLLFVSLVTGDLRCIFLTAKPLHSRCLQRSDFLALKIQNPIL